MLIPKISSNFTVLFKKISNKVQEIIVEGDQLKKNHKKVIIQIIYLLYRIIYLLLIIKLFISSIRALLSPKKLMLINKIRKKKTVYPKIFI